MNFLEIANEGWHRYQRRVKVLRVSKSRAQAIRSSKLSVGENVEVKAEREKSDHPTPDLIKEMIDELNFIFSTAYANNVDIDFRTWNPSVNGYGARSDAYDGMEEVLLDAGHDLDPRRASQESLMRWLSMMNHMPLALQANFPRYVSENDDSKIPWNYFADVPIEFDLEDPEEHAAVLGVVSSVSRKARQVVDRPLQPKENVALAPLIERRQWEHFAKMAEHAPSLVGGMLSPIHHSTAPTFLRLPSK